VLKHNASNMHQKVEVKLHILLSSSLDGKASGQVQASTALSPPPGEKAPWKIREACWTPEAAYTWWQRRTCLQTLGTDVFIFMGCFSKLYQLLNLRHIA